jgi:hypothetical protein
MLGKFRITFFFLILCLYTVKSGNIVFGINIVISEAQFVIANNLLIYD